MENNSQAIEIKGIVRNQTKIGVQDGQCDDIVNLRFKNGSWRVADDGKLIENFHVNGYTQLYVHTNVYHNLLGVKKGKLYWFAEIAADNETFTTLANPVPICEVEGDITITQNGHLLTILANQTDTTRLPSTTSGEQQKHTISYSIFKTSTKEYKELKVNPNGEQTDRELFPFGRVHFNTVSSDSDEYSVSQKEWGDATFETPYETNSYAIDKLAEKGLISMPLLAVAAIKDYDGNYIYASNPQYIFPKERFYYLQEEGKSIAITYKYAGENYNDKNLVKIDKVGICNWSDAKEKEGYNFPVIDCDENPSYFQELSEPIPPMNILMNTVPLFHGVSSGDYETIDRYYFGSKLTLSIDNFDILEDNSDVFQSLCIFVTRQINIFPNAYNDLSECDKDYDSSEKYIIKKNYISDYPHYKNVRAKRYVINDLMNSPFYLLREYDKNKITELKKTPIIDLSLAEYKDVLRPDVLVQRDRLDSVAYDRKDYIPKIAYQYNAKLHIANYKSNQFHGYPIDSFQFSNHSVKVEKGSYAVGGVLPNLKDGVDVQYPRTQYPFMNRSAETFDQYIQVSKDKGYCFASIRVIIETQQGDQQVVRYIQPYEAHKFTNGDNANFVESLGALLLFPDYRAKEMEVAVICLHEGRVYRRSKTFKLTPHTYLNIAYYINPQLKPIDLPVTGSSTGVEFDDFITNSQIGLFVTPSERNNTEDYPNGLKVSLVNNPFFFPYETTYQVGSSEIVALMSNAVAVGTGQTGAAPLYVFCKDGIYSLMVDSSGEMTYTNARIIARDVCNNAKSVTPIDNGVVFTTDRGLMSIAGSEVVEIGSAAEGDVFDITDTSDKAKKIMFNAFTMPQLAEFPQSLIDNTDFLTYLKGAIVNYNHNERELMVSNPDKDYTYVMDRNGNWSRRAFTAQEYVNNYPTSYRIDKAGNFYKVDADDNDTNKVYLLSNVIKLGTIAFKQAYRLVVRGYFETVAAKLGLYVFGSYDGRQWALLGANERDDTYQSGKFTDIGCKISHTDIRFLRVCLAGKLSKDTRIDYIEVSADGSALNGKLR